MSINPIYSEIKEQIRDTIDIVELVGRFVPLRRSGRLYVGRCPWHDDSKPSLQVNPERQSYKCWVCDIGGDIFSFIQQMEKVDFKESLKILADMAGVELPRRNSGYNSSVHDGVILGSESISHGTHSGTNGNTISNGIPSESNVPKIDKQVSFSALDWVCKQYQLAFRNHSEAAAAREYLTARGITDESIVKFRIGYSPAEYDWLMKKIGNNSGGRRKAILQHVGVLVRPELSDNSDVSQYSNSHYQSNSRSYDRFRGRLMFPICDTFDHVVAFGGRVLPNSPMADRAKYINSPETPVFSKHRMLYGLDQARHTMRKSRRVLIMEGYTDCIMAHQCGVTDAVAVLGTALGPEHIRTLKRFVDKMVLVLDGDTAGRKRANEVFTLFLTHEADLRILTLPNNADPCEFLLEHGNEAFEHLLETTAVDALQHAFDSFTHGVNMRNVVEKSRAMESLLTVLAACPMRTTTADSGQVRRFEMTVQHIAEFFGLSETLIRSQIAELRAAAAKRNSRRENSSGENHSDHNEEYAGGGDHVIATSPAGLPAVLPDPVERDMLEMLFAVPDSFMDFFEQVDGDTLESPLTKQIWKTWRKLIDSGTTPTFERLLLWFDDSRMKNYLVSLDESAAEKGLAGMTATDQTAKQEWLTKWRQRLSDRETRKSHPQLVGELKRDSLNDDEKMRKLLEIQSLHRQRTNRPPT